MPPARSPRKPRSGSESPRKKPRKAATAKKKGKNKRDDSPEPDQWEVEYIQQMRSVKDEEGKGPWLYEYHVKWLNWRHEDDTWEPRSSFSADSDILDSFLDHFKSRGIQIPSRACYARGASFTPSKEWIAKAKEDALNATDMDVREISPARDLVPHVQQSYGVTRAVREADEDANYASQSSDEEEEDVEIDDDAMEDDDDDATSGSMSGSEGSLLDNDLGGYGDEYAYNDADNGFAVMFPPSTPRRRRRTAPATARIPANPPRRPRTGKKKVAAMSVVETQEDPQTTPRKYIEGRRAKGGSGPSTIRFVSPTRKEGVIRANRRHELEIHARGPLDAPPRKIDLTSPPKKTKKSKQAAKATVPLFSAQDMAECAAEHETAWRELDRAAVLESIDATTRRVVEDTSNPFIEPYGSNEQVDHEGPAFEDGPHPPPSPQLPASAGVVLHPDRLALMQEKDPLDFFLSDPPAEPTWSTTAASSGANATALVRQRWGSKDHAVRFDDAFEFHPGPVIDDGQAHADGEPEDGELSDTANSAQELSSTLRRLSFGDIIDDDVFDRQRSLQPPSMFHELEPVKKGAMNAAISTRPFGELEEGEILDERGLDSESDGWEGKGELVSALVWRSDSEDDANYVEETLEVDEW